MSTCKWPLSATEELTFHIYGQNKDWFDVAGLYIFTYATPTGWFPLYVGQADSFQRRMPNHERLIEAVQNGATHIHALVVPLQANRDKWEKMLIQRLQPPMNVQHRKIPFPTP